MKVTLSHPTNKLKGTVRLPASKSISNRALVLQSVSGSGVELHNLSEADDTVLMQMALAKSSGEIHLKNAGTCMRFLTAYFAATENTNVTLLCDERMEKRPIAELVDVLTQLGAEITYLKQRGFPPLQISGKKLNGGTVKMSAAASSQFVSALMMIGPLCNEDLTIELTGEITSAPYIEMTAKLMQQFGINIAKENSNTVRLSSSKPITDDIAAGDASIAIGTKSQITNLKSQISIEPDWSAASYWYEMAVLSEEAEILLPGLTLDSLQGDCVIAEYMHYFGVETTETEDGIMIKKSPQSAVRSPQFPKSSPLVLNLVDCPDLAPTLAVTAAATNSPLVLTGLQNLAIKESNRLNALETELTKPGFHITSNTDSLTIHPLKSQISNRKSQIYTYGDHRMAMAFAPLALVLGSVTIENPEVVEKSYPGFWEDLKRVGFNLSE